MTASEKTKTSLRQRTALVTAIAVIGFAGAANAFADTDPVDLNVVDRETGQPLQIWRHHGRLFVAGQPGARYSLRVTNHTDGRVLVVMSVDGVNILTGETAGYDQRGYVFSPYESYEVTGWRKSNTEVAAFTFAPLPQSYAARTGRPNDVGVIGMAIFKERVDVPAPALVTPEIRPDWRAESSRSPSGGADASALRRAMPPRAALPAPQRLAAPAGLPPPPPLESPPAPKAPPPPTVVTAARSAAPAPPAAAIPRPIVGGVVAERRDEKLGTAHGAREWSVVNVVAFARATSYPQSIRQIEYDTYDNLVAGGVIRPYAEYRPQPFPSKPDGAGYVPDPPNEP